MPYADVNDQRLFYEDTRDGEDAIVFSHGYFMSHGMFDAQVAALRDRWRCIAWDERGHGQTETTRGPFTYWDSASDLLGLLDRWASSAPYWPACRRAAILSLRAALVGARARPRAR